MIQAADISPIEGDIAYKKYRPILTALCCLASIILFIGITFSEKLYDWNAYKRWGAPSSYEIFNGSYWGLITSNFLHTEIWHIAFNLYWIWVLGKKVEFESNKAFYAFLIFTSALVSSLSQLSFTSEAGIGLSGIVYAFFGYALIKSRTTESYKNFPDNKTVKLFVGWLFLCIVLTQAKLWNVGNAAHVGGFIWGTILAYLSERKIFIQFIVASGIFLLIASSVFWNPFSTSWLSYKAYQLHQNQKINEAMVVYRQILSIDEDNEFAKGNLKQLEIIKLQKQAFELHSNNNYKEARKIYNQLLIIDPDEEWAKENLKLLPDE